MTFTSYTSSDKKTIKKCIDKVSKLIPNLKIETLPELLLNLFKALDEQYEKLNKLNNILNQHSALRKKDLDGQERHKVLTVMQKTMPLTTPQHEAIDAELKAIDEEKKAYNPRLIDLDNQCKTLFNSKMDLIPFNHLDTKINIPDMKKFVRKTIIILSKTLVELNGLSTSLEIPLKDLEFAKKIFTYLSDLLDTKPGVNFYYVKGRFYEEIELRSMNIKNFQKTLDNKIKVAQDLMLPKLGRGSLSLFPAPKEKVIKANEEGQRRYEELFGGL